MFNLNLFLINIHSINRILNKDDLNILVFYFSTAILFIFFNFLIFLF